MMITIPFEGYNKSIDSLLSNFEILLGYCQLISIDENPLISLLKKFLIQFFSLSKLLY